jgi:hypothetical protein
MCRVEQKKKNGSWFSLLNYPRKKYDDLKKNISLLAKIGANNIEFRKAEMLILSSSFVIHRDVVRFLGIPESQETNELSLLLNQETVQKIPDSMFRQLIKSNRVTIIPRQYTLHGEDRTLFIFTNDSVMNQFEEGLLQVSS